MAASDQAHLMPESSLAFRGASTDVRPLPASRFPLRNVEDLLQERGIDISHETVRIWWHRFGPIFAAEVRKRRIEGLRSSHCRWHLDEMFQKINGKKTTTCGLWRAVDHEAEVLESSVTKMRDKRAALKVLKKAMKKHGRGA